MTVLTHNVRWFDVFECVRNEYIKQSNHSVDWVFVSNQLHMLLLLLLMLPTVMKNLTCFPSLLHHCVLSLVAFGSLSTNWYYLNDVFYIKHATQLHTYLWYCLTSTSNTYRSIRIHKYEEKKHQIQLTLCVCSAFCQWFANGVVYVMHTTTPIIPIATTIFITKEITVWFFKYNFFFGRRFLIAYEKIVGVIFLIISSAFDSIIR